MFQILGFSLGFLLLLQHFFDKLLNQTRKNMSRATDRLKDFLENLYRVKNFYLKDFLTESPSCSPLLKHAFNPTSVLAPDSLSELKSTLGLKCCKKIQIVMKKKFIFHRQFILFI